MLNFMYLFSYDASGSDQARASPMIFNVKVYSIADKYDVVALKSQAKEKFEKAAKSCWSMEDFPLPFQRFTAQLLQQTEGSVT
jgi:speckle-type POZ protein